MIGTNPVHTFTLPFETAVIKTLRVNYAQLGRVILTKKETDAEIEGRSVSVQLTQEDTFKFSASYPVEIQLRGVKEDGTVFKTKVIEQTPSRCLDKEVLE